MLATFVFILSKCFLTDAMSDLPIIEVKHRCPDNPDGQPTLALIADVPTYGFAVCKNGGKRFESIDRALHSLSATFDLSDTGKDCIFNYIKGNNSYTLDVEVGWGEDRPLIPKSRKHSITCRYDVSGKLVVSDQTVSHWFPTPKQHQKLLGSSLVTANIRLQVLDDSNAEITWSAVPLGKKIRLKAYDTPESSLALRPLSCIAQSPESSYAILRDGCGDGLILDNTVGFKTERFQVNSPLFDAFHLPGGSSLQFVCNFTICDGFCDGDSCSDHNRVRREAESSDVSGKDVIVKAQNRIFVAKSKEIQTKYIGDEKAEIHEKPRVKSELALPDTDASDYIMHLGSLTRDYPQIPKWNAEAVDGLKLSMLLTLSVVCLSIISTFLLSLYLCFVYETRPPRVRLFKV